MKLSRWLVLALALAIPPPLLAQAVFETAGALTASSRGTAVVAGLDAKGAWAQMIASTSITTKLLWVHFRQSDTPPFVLDIGTGAAASEVVVIPNLLFDITGGGAAGSFGPFRVDIPSGTRVAARAETHPTASGDETIYVELLLCDSEFPLLTSPTHASYGVTLGSTPKGNSIDPGGTAHTKGAYTELVASAAANIEHIQFVIGTQANVASATGDWLIDIATGADASEVVKIANLFVSLNATSDHVLPSTVIVPGDVFAGQRIAIRSQSTIIDATDRLLSVSALATIGTVPAGGGGGGLRIAGAGGLVSR